jgi:replication factor A3
MADPLSTPRLTSPHLEHFTSRTIRLTGRVTQLRGETATLDSDGAVTAQLNRDAHLTVGNMVEIVGKVNPDLSIRVLRATDLGRDSEFLVFLFILGVG